MESLTSRRAPSPCSTIPVTERGEDTISTVSCPGTEDNNKTTHTADSDPRTLFTLRNNISEDCTRKDGIKSQMSVTRRPSNFQHGIDPVEMPKSVWTKNRKRAFLYFLSIHFIPVAITLVLFWLYLDGFQWRASDIQLKTLLFAAKLHESLIVVSLGDILFHRIRYNLLTSRGVSFGLLVSPFHVSNPWSLFQAPFMASAGFIFETAPELLTILLIVLVSVLALLAAPSSGVLMIPRYDWWQIHNDQDAMARFKKQDLDDAIYIGAPFEDLFPLLIDGGFGPDSARDARLDTPSFSDRFEHILSGLDQILVDGSLRANANVTVVDGATVDSFALAYQEASLDDCEAKTCQNIASIRNTTVDEVHAEHIDCLDILCQSVAVQATSPLAIVTQKLFDRYRTWMAESSNMFMIAAQSLDSKEADLIWRQPSVSMQCSTVLHDGQNKILPISFQNWGSFPNFSISPDDSLLERLKEIEDQSSPLTIYTDISRLLPHRVTASTALLMYGGMYGGSQALNPATYLCLVDARWIESHVWFTAPYATIMRSGISMESVQATPGLNTSTAATSPVIKITDEYANSLDTNLVVSSTYNESPGSAAKNSPFDFIQRYCSRSVAYHLRPKCSILAHTLYMTDSLRRTQSTFRYHASKGLRESDNISLEPNKWTKLDYRLYQQLHAYKFEGSIIKLSMTVLLIHMMLVYAHVLLLVVGDGWCSRAWSELGELMALAILTQPSPLLKNAGGGIRNWQTWKLRTFVREVTSEGRLELVLKETVGSPQAMMELEDRQEKTLVEPEANRKYG
ncbi:hypothetical protein LA080_001502 [Diaporthe eres]|uniref:Uncharacterized protein n=1 Tax=Diaporthe vaccinii TaxID=105482 RepID=A0ABR4EVD9_9PEZI|nr:hypothetical protein LA080_001502 [Diaporthe eres]